ncbi:serine-threonine kinase receptor-associated -like [Olea europaea subsp. europaea]|uniref:Serine-threonine kinase receptor-associated protein n=1 Tax=Olea europaea subsp. europaea TaxID=158383 RepID=A0A8S0VJ54_OLEEU|nr:serine-threonine kinase receptor-associated -like [Olea europaea subsp. europaea]
MDAPLIYKIPPTKIKVKKHRHVVRICAFSEDLHLLLTGGVEKILRIFADAPPTEVEKSPGSVRTVAWLHSDQTILSSCHDMGGDVRTGTIVRTLETKSSVTSAEVSQDGRYIKTADGSTIKFWDANHFVLVKSYDMPCEEMTWIRLFDFHTGAEVGCNKGHHGPVHCLRFSPGGESYASGSEDGTIRMWQTDPSTHKELNYSAANGELKDGANEITHQMEKVDIAKEAKNDGSENTVEETTTVAN